MTQAAFWKLFWPGWYFSQHINLVFSVVNDWCAGLNNHSINSRHKCRSTLPLIFQKELLHCKAGTLILGQNDYPWYVFWLPTYWNFCSVVCISYKWLLNFTKAKCKNLIQFNTCKSFNAGLYELEFKNQDLLIFNSAMNLTILSKFAKIEFCEYFHTVAREGCTFRNFHAWLYIKS